MSHQRMLSPDWFNSCRILRISTKTRLLFWYRICWSWRHSLRFTIDLSKTFLDAVRSHARKPNLHLLGGYHEGQVLSLMPFVRSLKESGVCLSQKRLSRFWKMSGSWWVVWRVPQSSESISENRQNVLWVYMGHTTGSTVAEYEPSSSFFLSHHFLPTPIHS